MTPYLLEVKNLKKYFPVTAGLFKQQVGSVKAVDGVDFNLKKGQVLGLVGESGSGKSTIARCVMRLIEPSEGSVIYEGHDLLKLTPKELKPFRKKIQIIFQDPYASLNPRKTISESIGEPLLYHGLVSNESEKRERVAQILSQIGMASDVMNRYPHQFSGGQQQRICIGRAIGMQPDLIVCDEALSALDVSVQAQILNLLNELKETMGLSYLFISHDLSIVKYICDHIVVLYLGKIMESAASEQLFADPRHPYTQALLSATPPNHPGQKKNRIFLKGETPSPIHPPSGCPFRTRCGYAQDVCALPPPHKHPNDDHDYYCIL